MSAEERPESAKAARRRRREAVFGDVLPDTTSDERDPGDGRGGSGAREDAGEEWLRRQVPPHHTESGG